MPTISDTRVVQLPLFGVDNVPDGAPQSKRRTVSEAAAGSWSSSHLAEVPTNLSGYMVKALPKTQRRPLGPCSKHKRPTNANGPAKANVVFPAGEGHHRNAGRESPHARQSTVVDGSYRWATRPGGTTMEKVAWLRRKEWPGMNVVTDMEALDVCWQLWVIPDNSGGLSKDLISLRLSAYRAGPVRVHGDFETQFDDSRVGRSESGFTVFSLSVESLSNAPRVFVAHEG